MHIYQIIINLLVASTLLAQAMEPMTKELFERACAQFGTHNYKGAIEGFKKVQSLSPCPESYFNCGMAYLALDKLQDAYREFQAAITLDPHYTKAYLQTSTVLQKMNQPQEALNQLKKALDIDPSSIQAKMALARLYCDLEDRSVAQHHLQSIIARGIPQSIEIAFECSNLFLLVGNPWESVRILEYLHSHYPSNSNILNNLAYSLKLTGNLKRTITILKTYCNNCPEKLDAQLALSHAYLTMGDFKQGWKELDKFLLKTNRYSRQIKEWIEQGKIKGKRILLRQEGGLGDTIQWVRCAELLKKAGAYIIAVIPQALVPLISTCPFIDTIRALETTKLNQLNYDAHSTIMSLPAVFELTETQMAPTIPYLNIQKNLAASWQEQLSHDKNFKIGLCLNADKKHDSSRIACGRRSIAPEQLKKLGTIPRISFYSLHHYKTCKEGESSATEFNIIEFEGDFDQSHGSFMDTAAVILNMDLVITVDTATAHLAGALGKPVWLLLPFQADWRWIAERTDSPWYPTMRIFKQSVPFDWESVIAQVYQELINLKSHQT